MGNKIFKNLDEQVEILKQKNLTINDVDYAKEVLLRENYFFLNGYRYPFIKSLDNKVYIDGVTFEELYSLFLFDRKLRNVVFKNILMIENNIKSIISYQLSKKYGCIFSFVGGKILSPLERKERQEKVSKCWVKKFVSYTKSVLI